REKAFPQTLSGGEQQRVALARALARNPAAVFLDEPFSGLDTGLRQEVRDASLAALRASGAAVLLVTHDAEEALSMGDDIALMSGGRLLQTGTPRACYLNPVSETAARLLGETNLLSAVVQQHTATTAFGPLAAPDHADGPVRISVRPEGLIAAEPGSPGSVTAKVIESRYRGAVCDLTLLANGHEAHVHWPALTAPEAGDTVHVRLDPRFCQIFA
ncbi:MAG: ABC transporter ATP-binding protein, partial [Asticcacaulis sp.]